MGSAGFWLVIAALAVFLLSTRQWTLWLRLLIWIAGAGLLGGAVYLIWWDPAHEGLFRVIADAIDNPDLLNSTLARALTGNQRSVAGAIVPMLDLFIAGAILVGILALLAFTPGERLEKMVRPLAIGLAGAIGGSILTLAVIAIGFGGYQKRQAYFGIVTEVIDGDTIRMDAVRLRLAGIDAPEKD